MKTFPIWYCFNWLISTFLTLILKLYVLQELFPFRWQKDPLSGDKMIPFHVTKGSPFMWQKDPLSGDKRIPFQVTKGSHFRWQKDPLSCKLQWKKLFPIICKKKFNVVTTCVNFIFAIKLFSNLLSFPIALVRPGTILLYRKGNYCIKKVIKHIILELSEECAKCGFNLM